MTHSRKTHTLVLLALCLLLTLAGCGSKTLLSQPIQPLTCIQPTSIPTLIPRSSGQVLAGWVDYDSNATYLSVVDIAKDQVTASRQLEGCWELQAETFTDGSAALFNWEDGTWQFIDAGLADAGTYSNPQYGGVFSHDGSTYYFVQDGVLCRAGVSSGAQERVALASDMRFSDVAGIYPDSDTLFLHCRLSPYSTNSGTAILDVTTGACSMLQEAWYAPYYGASGPEFLQFREETGAYDMLFPYEGQYYLADAALLHSATEDLMPVSGSDYLIGAAQNTTIYRLTDSISACTLTDDQLGGALRGSVWLPEASVMVGSVYDESGLTQLVAVDPAQLTFSPLADAAAVGSPVAVDDTLTDIYWSELNGSPLPATLQEARDYADRLEERYGVTILLSSQAKEVCASVWDAVITTTDEAGLADEPHAIARMLEALDRTLALYPEDFFRQMRNSMDEGGVRIMPVGHIDNAVNAIGLTSESYEWQNVFIDVTIDAFEGTICHELWHAIEGVILTRNWSAFDQAEWDRCNPDGFRYNEEAGTPASDPERWTFFHEFNAQDVYFVDAYARTNAKEDRARLMEYMMATEDVAGALMQSPAMVQKLEIMCRAVRENFDTSGWSDLRWERLLPTA